MSFYKRTALSSEQEEDGQQLRVAEFVAYGSYDASIEGSIDLIHWNVPVLSDSAAHLPPNCYSQYLHVSTESSNCILYTVNNSERPVDALAVKTSLTDSRTT